MYMYRVKHMHTYYDSGIHIPTPISPSSPLLLQQPLQSHAWWWCGCGGVCGCSGSGSKDRGGGNNDDNDADNVDEGDFHRGISKFEHEPRSTHERHTQEKKTKSVLRATTAVERINPPLFLPKAASLVFLQCLCPTYWASRWLPALVLGKKQNPWSEYGSSGVLACLQTCLMMFK